MTSKYFDKCIKQDMIEGMLLPVRKSAGYGANFFYSNPVESVHSKFKNRIQRVKADKEISGKPERLCSFIEAAQLYHDLLKEHWRNITRCIINEGPYELSPNFKRLCIPVDVWLTMDIHKKVKKLRKIAFIPSTITDDIPTYINDANNSNNVNSDSVMPDFEASGLPSSYKTDWDGAKYYVQNAETTVQKSTLLRNVYHIKSRSSPDKINIIRVQQNNRITCSCPRYTHCDICAHSIFTAFYTSKLELFLSNWKPSLKRMMDNVTPSNTGKKKNERTGRKRFKHSDRNIAGYELSELVPNDERFHVVFVSDTRSL